MEGARRASPRERETVSVSVAARIAGCSHDTILRKIEEGLLQAWRISPRGWWKIERESLLRYLDRQAPRSSGNAGF